MCFVICEIFFRIQLYARKFRTRSHFILVPKNSKQFFTRFSSIMKKIQKYLCAEEIHKTKFSSPIGPIKIETCVHGLRSVDFDSTVTNDNFLQKASSSIEILKSSSDDSLSSVKQFKRWLENFFFEFEADPDVDICSSVIGVEGSRTFRQKGKLYDLCTLYMNLMIF